MATCILWVYLKIYSYLALYLSDFNSSYCVMLWFIYWQNSSFSKSLSLHFYFKSAAKGLAHSNHLLSNEWNKCALQWPKSSARFYLISIPLLILGWWSLNQGGCWPHPSHLPVALPSYTPMRTEHSNNLQGKGFVQKCRLEVLMISPAWYETFVRVPSCNQQIMTLAD